MAGFLDLGVPAEQQVGQLVSIFDRLVAVGWSGTALEVVAEIDKVPAAETLPVVRLGDLERASSQLRVERRAFTQYSRLTVPIRTPQQSFKVNNRNAALQAYDVLAVAPQGEKLFAQACQTMDVDVITFDATQRLPFPLRFPTVHTAVQRGVFFELRYAQALGGGDPAKQRQFIGNALHLIRVTKGRNILLSSGAMSMMDVRTPRDVQSLALLLGLSQAQVRLMLDTAPRLVLNHAAARKTYRTVIKTAPVTSLAPNEFWKVPLLAQPSAPVAETEVDEEEGRPP